MALSSTTVNGTSVPGLLQSITTGTAPVGQKTTSPAQNITPPPNTTSTPAPIDLSGTYGKDSKGTIYNTKTNTAFSNPADFFTDSGQKSFNNLKFADYTPTGKETIYGQQPVQPTPQVQPVPQTPPVSSNPTPTATSTGNPAPTTTPTTATGAPATPPAPNGGQTGVSQGGIIGGLVSNASSNPDYEKYQGLYQQLAQKIADTTKSEQEQLGANANNPIPIEFQQGRSSVIQSQYGGLLQALATQQGAAQQGVNNSISEQGATNTGLSSAGSLNAPVTNPQTGGLVSPSANTTTGATTSGAANLSSLIGQRTIPGQTQAEFYNTQTGQGFSTPQALADFVNQQQPGIGATAQNVFDLLKSQGQSQGGALNPISQVDTIAQQVINGQKSISDAKALGGTVTNWGSLLNAALIKANGGTAPDESALQAKYDANQTTQGTQAQQQAAYQSAHQQAQALGSQLNDLITSSGVNPSDVNAVNSFIQGVAKNVSSPQYKILSNYLTDVASRYAQILTPTGGSQTDTVRSTAQGMLDSTASGQSIQSVLQALDQQAQAVITSVHTPSTTGQNSTPPAGFGWNG